MESYNLTLSADFEPITHAGGGAGDIVIRQSESDNVIIMPISNVELTELMDKKDEYDEIIDRVRELFVTDEKKFDREWRDNFIQEVIGGFT